MTCSKSQDKVIVAHGLVFLSLHPVSSTYLIRFILKSNVSGLSAVFYTELLWAHTHHFFLQGLLGGGRKESINHGMCLLLPVINVCQILISGFT